jgi:hypothetical protein
MQVGADCHLMQASVSERPVLNHPKPRSADSTSAKATLKMSPKHGPETIRRRKMPGEARAIRLLEHTKRTV